MAHLEADGRQRDPELVEELLLRHGGNLVGGLFLDEIAEHRGGRLADGAATAVEPDLLDDVAVSESHGDEDLVAAERILPSACASAGSSRPWFRGFL